MATPYCLAMTVPARWSGRRRPLEAEPPGHLGDVLGIRHGPRAGDELLVGHAPASLIEETCVLTDAPPQPRRPGRGRLVDDGRGVGGLRGQPGLHLVEEQ